MEVKVSSVNIKKRQEIGLRAGDTVRVSQKIQEKGKTRIQVFEGLVLARKHGNEPGGTFTVRKVSNGVGVEKIFPLYSPMIDKIEIVRRSKVRRSKLYFIREKVAREIRKQMRNMRMTDISTGSDIEEKEETEKAEEEKQAAEAKKAEEKAKGEAEEKSKTEEVVPEEEKEEPKEEAPKEENPKKTEENKEKEDDKK
jgi:large subunit ribosomal protein L19